MFLSLLKISRNKQQENWSILLTILEGYGHVVSEIINAGDQNLSDYNPVGETII